LQVVTRLSFVIECCIILHKMEHTLKTLVFRVVHLKDPDEVDFIALKGYKFTVIFALKLTRL